MGADADIWQSRAGCGRRVLVRVGAAASAGDGSDAAEQAAGLVLLLLAFCCRDSRKTPVRGMENVFGSRCCERHFAVGKLKSFTSEGAG